MNDMDVCYILIELARIAKDCNNPTKALELVGLVEKILDKNLPGSK